MTKQTTLDANQADTKTNGYSATWPSRVRPVQCCRRSRRLRARARTSSYFLRPARRHDLRQHKSSCAFGVRLLTIRAIRVAKSAVREAPGFRNANLLRRTNFRHVLLIFTGAGASATASASAQRQCQCQRLRRANLTRPLLRRSLITKLLPLQRLSLIH